MGAGSSRPRIVDINIELIDDRPRRNRQSSHLDAFRSPFSTRRNSHLSYHAHDSGFGFGGGRTRAYTTGTLGSRGDSRRVTSHHRSFDDRDMGFSGRRAITQYGDRDMGFSGRGAINQYGERDTGLSRHRSTSHHGDRQLTSHSGSHGRRTSGVPQRVRAQSVGGRLSTIRDSRGAGGRTGRFHW
jgi:hypothetical protein